MPVLTKADRVGCLHYNTAYDKLDAVDVSAAALLVMKYEERVRSLEQELTGSIILQEGLTKEVTRLKQLKEAWQESSELQASQFQAPEQCHRGCMGDEKGLDKCVCGYRNAVTALEKARSLDPEVYQP